MEDAEELDPCPFGSCATEFLNVKVVTDRRPNIFKAWVECEDCGAKGPQIWAMGDIEARSLAVFSWNERRK